MASLIVDIILMIVGIVVMIIGFKQGAGIANIPQLMWLCVTLVGFLIFLIFALALAGVSLGGL